MFSKILVKMFDLLRLKLFAVDSLNVIFLLIFNIVKQ